MLLVDVADFVWVTSAPTFPFMIFFVATRKDCYSCNDDDTRKGYNRFLHFLMFFLSNSSFARVLTVAMVLSGFRNILYCHTIELVDVRY